jgi:UPF0716 protein FxsA
MAAVLFLGFIVVPILEIYVILRVGDMIGFWPTVILLLAESFLGAWLVKREGRKAWRALREALGTGRLPSRQLADAALVLVGGTLLLTPGFLTDVAGFAFILPATRPLARRMLAWLLMSRLFAGTRIGRAMTATRGARTTRGEPGRASAAGPGGPGGSGRTAPPGAGGRVVPGEVVDEDGPAGQR